MHVSGFVTPDASNSWWTTPRIVVKAKRWQLNARSNETPHRLYGVDGDYRVAGADLDLAAWVHRSDPHEGPVLAQQG